MERQSDKELKAAKSLEANRKYRQNMRDKISLVHKDDTRLDELLNRIKLIQKRLDGIMSDSDSNSDTESEPDQIEPVVKKPEIKKAEPKKEVKKSEIKKAEPKKEEPPEQIKPDVERKYMHNYPVFV
jgi:Mn-containing catalase